MIHGNGWNKDIVNCPYKTFYNYEDTMKKGVFYKSIWEPDYPFPEITLPFIVIIGEENLTGKIVDFSNSIYKNVI
jgi:hypothetical protein